MNFDFTQDQYLLRDSVRRFLADRWSTRRLRAANGSLDADFWSELCGLGLQTLLVPERFGGSGLGFVDLALVLEEFGRALVPPPMVDTILCADVFSTHGPGDRHESVLTSIAEGSCRVAFAHHEAGRGDAASEVQAKARRVGERWLLDGVKTLVPGALAATHLLASARPAGGPARLFFCTIEPAGVTLEAHRAVDSSALLCRVELNGCEAEALDEGALERMLELSTVAAATQMAGIAGAALDLAVEYAKQRTQFDKPIGSFQAIKHKCADMLVAVEGARSAAFFAAWAVAERDTSAPLAASIAKATAGDSCRLACNDALQIHGGVGFTNDFDVHLYLKRGKLLEYSFGDAAFHRERVAAVTLGQGRASPDLSSFNGHSTGTA